MNFPFGVAAQGLDESFSGLCSRFGVYASGLGTLFIPMGKALWHTSFGA
jgi:hypothetical protein